MGEEEKKLTRIGGESSYNRFLAVSARAVRSGLKPEKVPATRAAAEIKITKWAVRQTSCGRASFGGSPCG